MAQEEIPIEFNYERIKDTEELFSNSEKIQLESYLNNIESREGKEVYITTFTPKSNSNSEWIISSTISPYENMISIFVSKSRKYIEVSVGESSFEEFETSGDSIREEIIIPHFENENYIEGITNGIDEIIKLIEN